MQSRCRHPTGPGSEGVPVLVYPGTDGHFIVLFYPGMGTSVEIDHLASTGTI